MIGLQTENVREAPHAPQPLPCRLGPRRRRATPHTPRLTPPRRTVALCLAAILAVTGTAFADEPRPQRLPSAQLEGIDIVERLGERVPGELTFTNSGGEQVEINDYLDQGRPVVFNLIYFGCPMLCHLATQGLVDVLQELAWTPGDEFTVLTVSFDPTEGPDIARTYHDASIAALGRDEARDGWSFLTGDEANIAALTDALGFGYEWVDEKGEYAHAAALILVTPDGRISRYLHGVHHEPTTLRRGLVEASEGGIGSFVDQVLWRCLAYDPDAGEYIVAAWAVLRLGGGLTVLLMAAALGSLWFLEIRRKKKTAAHP